VLARRNAARELGFLSGRSSPRRTGAGRIAAKKRGVKFGRPPKPTPQQAAHVARLVDQGQSVPEVASIFEVHEATIYRCLAAREARR
jgi:DNA invertase Pin-like site-specific DNA recombinase